MKFRTLLLFSLVLHLSLLAAAFDFLPKRKPIFVTSLSEIFFSNVSAKQLNRKHPVQKASMAFKTIGASDEYSQNKQRSLVEAETSSSSRLLDLKEILSLGNEPPEYPPLALERGYEGVVRLHLSRRVDGKVGQVRVSDSSGFNLLDRAAIDAARQWKLGTQGPQEIVVPVRFRIEKD